MLYSFAKILMTAALRFFYRHIHVTGFENIPSTGPAIIIANHNSSLMDAALLGILLKRKAWFFARGDVFVNKPVQKILWWLHMMPVHSHQGGKKTLRANQDSFFNGKQILASGGIIVFFPESYSHIEHQLLPFRKGVFRLAFDTATEHHFSFDIPIIPVGITYDDPVACRMAVQVHADRPLSLFTYKDEYLHNAAAALLHICKDAQLAVGKLVLHVANKNRLQTLLQYLAFSRSNTMPGGAWKKKSKEKLLREQQICYDLSQAPGLHFETKKQKAVSYSSLLMAAGLTDNIVKKNTGSSAGKTLLLVIGFPFYLLGLMLNGLPVLTGRTIADKKVLRKDFYSWIFVACSAVAYFLWLAILVTAMSFAGWWYAAGLLLLMPGTGIFAYAYKGWLKEGLQQKKWRRLPAEKRKELMSCRAAIDQPMVNTIVSPF
jgi:1-acyl-sn-glycerol-3-phosphate acyltransferase